MELVGPGGYKVAAWIIHNFIFEFEATFAYLGKARWDPPDDTLLGHWANISRVRRRLFAFVW